MGFMEVLCSYEVYEGLMQLQDLSRFYVAKAFMKVLCGYGIYEGIMKLYANCPYSETIKSCSVANTAKIVVFF